MQHATNEPADGSIYVLDSYALLAHLKGEESGKKVRTLFNEAREGKCRLYLCVVNFGEVMYIMERERGASAPRDTLSFIDALPIEVVDVDRKLALAAAHLKMDCPISFADCFAAALSQQMNAILVTGDPEFNKLKPECDVRIEWLR